MNQSSLTASLGHSINWFLQSGIMDPADGSWGVAERIVLPDGNEALERIYTTFPAYSAFERHTVIEHRRPDCNFQTALLFLLAGRCCEHPDYQTVTRNLVHYLYRRSGMRNTRYQEYPLDVWRWANEKWAPVVYFDDNAWNATLALVLARLAPDLDAAYGLRASALTLTDRLLTAFQRQFPGKAPVGGEYQWHGRLDSPHWGSLVCMALAAAIREGAETSPLADAITAYERFLADAFDTFTTSEHAYIVLGASLCAAWAGTPDSLATARRSADLLVARQDPATGNIPSEWSSEAPVGPHLVDTIYTLNWALPGLQTLAALSGESHYRTAFEKALNLLIRIQDPSPEKHLAGCWRGMYDLARNQWDGGNRYEGGAGSIYSGWTNAPIAATIALELMDRNLANLTDH